MDCSTARPQSPKVSVDRLFGRGHNQRHLTIISDTKRKKRRHGVCALCHH